MADKDKEDRVRGLKAVQEHRESRGKMRWPPAKYWGWAGVVMLLMMIFNYKWSLGELESMRAKLLSKQRAARAEIEPQWVPLRDKLEAWTQELAKGSSEDVVDHEALNGWNFRERKGIYLRLRAEDAGAPDAIRKAAKDSLRDAFTACLAVAPNENPLAGKECKKSSECAAGEHCNEQDRCSKPAQPFNLRIAYRAFSVMTDEWVREVQGGNELTVRALDGTYDSIWENDVRLAMGLVLNSEYFLVVIDEKAENEPPPAGTDKTSKLAETRQALQHFARIGVWRIGRDKAGKDDKLVIRLRRETAGQLMGASGALDPEVAEARQRQANSCSLAIAVRQAMGDTNAAAVPPKE
jgi:hypothetical protein